MWTKLTSKPSKNQKVGIISYADNEYKNGLARCGILTVKRCEPISGGIFKSNPVIVWFAEGEFNELTPGMIKAQQAETIVSTQSEVMACIGDDHKSSFYRYGSMLAQ